MNSIGNIKNNMLIRHLVFLIFLSSLALSQRIIPESVQQKVNQIAEQIKPAIVKIYAVIPDYENGKEIKMEVSGSGTIIHPDGFVLTNYHVAGRASYVQCILSNGEKIDAIYYAGDPLTDLAIVKLTETRKYPYAKFGDSSKLKVGDWVIAAGSPYALSQSLTLGIVSNTKLVIPEIFSRLARMEIEGENVGSIITWIGHDAPIYEGNSGGPLLNLYGEIVGVNEMRFALSAAIPGNIAMKIADELIRNREITRSWLGIEIQPLLATSKIKQGVLVSGVLKGSPAEKAGLKAGDIILQVGDKKVKVETIEDMPYFNQLISGLPLDRYTRIIFLRGGKQRAAFLLPIKRERTYCETKEVRRLGITARDISRYEMLELKRESQDGVVVTGVRPGGPAGEAKPSLQEKDVITEIEGTPIRNLEDLNKCLEGIKGDSAVIFKFDREKEKMLTVVRLKEEKEMEKIPYAKKGWLPVEVQSLTDDIRNKLKIEKRGVMVTRVYTKDKSFPLKVGDMIVEIEGESLPIRTPSDKAVFFERLTDYQIGSEIELTLIRDGQEIKLKVPVSAEPPSRDDVAKFKETNLGMTVRELCFDDLKEMSDEKKGVIVDAVEEGSWASLARLGVGDLILEVNGEKIDTIDKFKEMIDKAKSEKKDLVFYIERDTEHKFIEIKKLVWEAKK